MHAWYPGMQSCIVNMREWYPGMQNQVKITQNRMINVYLGNVADKKTGKKKKSRGLFPAFL